MISSVLTNLGEKMSDEEVDELLKAVDTSSGEINYTGTPVRLQGCGEMAANVGDRSCAHNPSELIPERDPFLFLKYMCLRSRCDGSTDREHSL